MNMKDEIQIASKDRFIRRVYRIFFTFIIIGMILTFLLVYQPMKTELEKSLISNLVYDLEKQVQMFCTETIGAKILD